MLSGLFHWLLAQPLFLYVAGALGVAGIVSAFFLRAPLSMIVRLAGYAALAAAVFLAGYQEAEQRAAQRRQMEALQIENEALSRDLTHQKTVAGEAKAERDAMRERLADREKKVMDYEQRIARESAKASGACALNDADIRALRGLRSNPR